MLKNKKAVIFDLDGTLIDSMWMWKDIDIEFLEKRGKLLPEDLQKNIEGMSFTETAHYFKETFLLKESIEELKSIWIDMAKEKYEKEVPLKEGALEFLDELKFNQIKMGIATSNSKELVRVVLESLNITHYFECIMTSCQVEKGKPSPDIYLAVANNLEVQPDDCIVFEDVPMGILAGKAANMKVCAIYDEFSQDAKKEIQRLADYYINSFYDIKNRTYEELEYEK